nr:retrovirus-related Pol polyprotein from transposon TNT 1-94 [Tanacetum cinerariifolium]
IQKQLKKANTTLAQELKEYKTILAETKEHDIEKMLSMEKQLKCLNEVVYKRSQSIQTIHMMAPKEMHADLKYVESLEKEIDELKSDKAEFSDMYDVILQECVSNALLLLRRPANKDIPVSFEYQRPMLIVTFRVSWSIDVDTRESAKSTAFDATATRTGEIAIDGGEKKPENQWTGDERKAANLDQRLKSLTVSVLLDDQMDCVITFLTTKSTWDDMILYHEGLFDEKESRVMDLKLCYNTFKFKEDSPDDKEDIRSNHEYMNDLEEEYQARAFLTKSKRFFKKDDNESVEVKVLMALAEENDVVSKEGTRNGEWVMISMRKCDIKKPIWYLDSGCSRHMTGIKSYLHKYMEQPGPKMVFGDDSTCTIEGYGSIKCNAFENLNWLWHKRLAHLNFKTIIKLAKQNLVIGLPLLLNSKDKPCSSCEKGKHHRASFKTKQTSSIKKCLHLLHMDLFGHKKSQAPKTIMSFIKRVENQNDINVKQLRIDNGTELKNSTLVNFCDEKRISQNFSSPYTPEQNGVAKRKNRTFIEAATILLSGSVFSKQYWIEAVATACYTQNRSTIVKRHLKTPYEIFYKRIPNISFLYVFGCPVYIHNHRDRLENFDEKADDGYLLGYSLVSKAFRVFNTRRQQTKETCHIMKALKLSNSQYHQLTTSTLLNQKDIHLMNIFILINLLKVSSDQNDQPVQNNEILNDDHSEHSNHTNYEQIIDSLPNAKDIQISEHLSSSNTEDTSA